MDGGSRQPVSSRLASLSDCLTTTSDFSITTTPSPGARRFRLVALRCGSGLPAGGTVYVMGGPLLIHRFSPKILILIGTALTFLAFHGFAHMPGSLMFYYSLFFVYTVGYILLGTHSAPGHRFAVVPQEARHGDGNRVRRRRTVRLGGAYLVNYVANNYGFHVGAAGIGRLRLVGVADRDLGSEEQACRYWPVSRTAKRSLPPTRRSSRSLSVPAAPACVLASNGWQLLLHRLHRRG